jgi:phosphatidylglycerophosphatase A
MRFKPVRSKKIWGQTPGQKIIIFLATGFYTGYAPVVPGTFGTLVGIPIAFLLSFLNLGMSTMILIALIIVSCWIADEAEKIYGIKDPNDIVIDEVVGYLVTVWTLPFTWVTVLAGFFLFRILDILKPFPIRKIESWVPGGTGVVMDDVLAGVYGGIILSGLIRLWHG